MGVSKRASEIKELAMMEETTVGRLMRQTVPSIGRAIDDPEALAQALAVRDALDAEIAKAVDRLREDDGFSWAELARPLGITRQALAQRFTSTTRTAHAAAQRRHATKEQ